MNIQLVQIVDAYIVTNIRVYEMRFSYDYMMAPPEELYNTQFRFPQDVSSFIAWTKDWFGNRVVDVSLDWQIPPARYLKHVKELSAMANTYKRNGNTIRASEHYYKLLLFGQLIRDQPSFFAGISSALMKDIELVERQAWKVLQSYLTNLSYREQMVSLSSMVSPGRLRYVYLPSRVIAAYMNQCNKGPVRGYLGGVLDGEFFRVTHLFMKPAAPSTPVLNIGIILCKPSQDSYLDFQDMVALYLAQCFLPESVAVVCNRGVAGAYKLTEIGLKAVQGRSFLPPHIYQQQQFVTEASHCVLDTRANIVVVDSNPERIASQLYKER
ncbi:hypothetical protein AAG570_012150 [Ranatra chinensis]|uniref:Uncharacterized protein n=1 Tax=Ranatra chinensis TaxID=642074 RepID=A0ABD0YK17_9HEMI